MLRPRSPASVDRCIAGALACVASFHCRRECPARRCRMVGRILIRILFWIFGCRGSGGQMVMCPPILCRQRALWKQMHMCVSRHAQSAVALRFDVHQPEGNEGSTAARGQAALVLASAVFRRFRGCGSAIALPSSASFCHRDAAQAVSAAVALLCNEASQPSFDVVSPTGATQADRAPGSVYVYSLGSAPRFCCRRSGGADFRDVTGGVGQTRVRLPSVCARLVRHASVSACRVKQLQSAERRSCNVMVFW